MWGKLIEAHEGTSNVKSVKLFICKDKFEKFALLPNEELKYSFSCLNNIVNELKDLGFDVPEVDISHKFLRALPPKYETIVTLLVRSSLKNITPSEVLGEVLVEIVSNLDDLLGDIKGKYKNLKKKHVSLQESYEELKTSDENLLDTHEKLNEAHNSHISQQTNKVKVNVGITCDLLDDMSKIDKVLKSSISTSCDDLLVMPYF
jgi:hypothetical protein